MPRLPVAVVRVLRSSRIAVVVAALLFVAWLRPTEVRATRGAPLLVAAPNLAPGASLSNEARRPLDAGDAAPTGEDGQDRTSAPLAPLAGTWLEDLGDDVGVVAIPLGATTRRPVVVSLHGAGSAAEWACGDWMGPTDGYPFIVCPRSRNERRGGVGYWTSPGEAAARADEALVRTRQRYGAWMSEADPVWVGFSQGAEMVVAAAQRGAMRWAAVFVHEGGYRQQSAALAQLLAGPRAVVATCSTLGCGARLPKARGPRAFTANYGPHGHSTGPVYRELRADFARLVAGRQEWAAPSSPR